MKLLPVNVFNSDAVKLQGIAYYSDCYKFWDINKSLENFESSLYDDILIKIKQGSHGHYSGIGTMAVINFNDYENKYINYYRSLSKNVQRDVEKCKKKGYYIRQYDLNKFLQDFSKINFSQLNRKENVNPWYLQNYLNFKGAHSGGYHKWEDESHYTRWYGMFKYLKNYKQENIITNERLYGYCKVAIEGEMASIHLIWSHTDCYKDGIMFALLVSVIEEVINLPNVKFLVYYGWGQYPKWKSRLLFEPCKLKVNL